MTKLKIYSVTRKVYLTDAKGIEYQAADGFVLPSLFRSYFDAEVLFKEWTRISKEVEGYQEIGRNKDIGANGGIILKFIELRSTTKQSRIIYYIAEQEIEIC